MFKLRVCHEITYTSILVLLLFLFVTKYSSNLGYYHILCLEKEQNYFAYFVHFISWRTLIHRNTPLYIIFLKKFLKSDFYNLPNCLNLFPFHQALL